MPDSGWKDFVPITEAEANLRGLRNLARQVFLDRNAEGFAKAGPDLRKRSRAAGRGHLRAAIRSARAARDALVAGDQAGFERWRAEARMHLAHGRSAMRAHFLVRVGKAINRPPGKRGGRPSEAERARSWSEDFDRRKRSNPSLTAQELYGDIADAWAAAKHPAVKWREVQKHVTALRKGQKKT